MTQRLLKKPLVWAFVAAAAFMAFIMTFSYLGAFVDPVGNMHNMPLAIVNEDAGVTLNGQQVNFGEQVLEAVTSTDPQLGDAVKWTVLSDRDEAQEKLQRNKFYAALIVPANYSVRLAGIGRPEGAAGAYAEIEVLTNPASGSVAGAESQSIATGVVSRISRSASAQIVQSLAGAGATLTPDRAPQVADPVRPKLAVAQPIGSKNARGLAPFYFAVMMTLAGFIGANIVHVGLEFVSGRLELDFLARRLRLGFVPASRWDLWLAKFVLVTAMSVMAGVLITWMAVGILGMDAAKVLELGLFAILGIAATGYITLFLLTAFGTAGLVLGVLFTTIFGVPSAGGVYPLEMIPGLFRFLSLWLPLRYMTDGARALIFFEGRGGAGLNPAILVLVAYAAGSALLAAAASFLIDRTLSRQVTPVKATLGSEAQAGANTDSI